MGKWIIDACKSKKNLNFRGGRGGGNVCCINDLLHCVQKYGVWLSGQRCDTWPHNRGQFGAVWVSGPRIPGTDQIYTTEIELNLVQSFH